MQATPLQLAQATALVASKGKWYRPHLAKTIEGQKPVDPDPVPISSCAIRRTGRRSTSACNR
jgi:cell division protein FtsI/penicillin-binding protein 2